jgi:site-specific DNA recombinase
VVVYKVDRLSRSLLDFARMMQTFDQYGISFVSVTQQFHTATSMGRLVLHVLLSFAQFEREIIYERTRDKIAAARRKGKWSGGTPILGYDVDVPTTRLVVNEAEAAQVRAIFELYLRRQTLRGVVEALHQRGWGNKRWQTRKGHVRGGRPFTKTSLHLLLTNVLYVGNIKHKSAVHPGEHQAIVTEELWQQVQDLLSAQGQTRGLAATAWGLAPGLLHCCRAVAP